MNNFYRILENVLITDFPHYGIRFESFYDDDSIASKHIFTKQVSIAVSHERVGPTPRAPKLTVYRWTVTLVLENDTFSYTYDDFYVSIIFIEYLIVKHHNPGIS